MSLLINGKQLTVGVALRDENHEMHPYAVEYTAGMAELRQKFGKVIKFVRPGYPRTNIGTDSRGREAHMLEPTPPMLLPLKREYAHPLRGKEIWSCCLDMPKLEPNGLWSMGNKRSIKITDFINVDLDRQPDLAYYLYYISKFGTNRQNGRLKVDDPKADIKAKADKKMQEVERTTAIWQMLDDEHKLRTMAAAYGVPNSGTKEPDQLKFDLEAQLEINDNRKRQDPLIKGTREFLEEMKVTDNVRLRAFIKNLEDSKKLVYKPDGRYHLGDKTLLQVPFESIKDTFGYICSYYNVPNNAEKLQDLMRDVVNKEYLDNIKDEKDFTWLAKVMGINTPFKKKEELKSMVYDAFSIAL